jgi:hypothetical protein
MEFKRLSPALTPVDVLDRVLDKGIVIDAEIRIALAGIELITVSATVRVASFATWDRYVATRERAPRGGDAVPARRTLAAGADAVAPAAHRVRLRCEQGCTFERRASTLALRDGGIAPQRCAVKPRRACAVTVI